MDASPADRLKAGEIADTRRFRCCVEVARDDRRKRTAVAGIKISQRNCLPLSRRLGFQAP
jgi:hypothetical protein